MKLAAGMMLVCVLLQPVGAQADELGTSSLVKETVVQPIQPAVKKNKAVRGKKVQPKSGVDKADPKVQEKPGALSESPPESIEQSIQLKGVRG